MRIVAIVGAAVTAASAIVRKGPKVYSHVRLVLNAAPEASVQQPLVLRFNLRHHDKESRDAFTHTLLGPIVNTRVHFVPSAGRLHFGSLHDVRALSSAEDPYEMTSGRQHGDGLRGSTGGVFCAGSLMERNKGWQPDVTRFFFRMGFGLAHIGCALFASVDILAAPEGVRTAQELMRIFDGATVSSAEHTDASAAPMVFPDYPEPFPKQSVAYNQYAM